LGIDSAPFIRNGTECSTKRNQNQDGNLSFLFRMLGCFILEVEPDDPIDK